MRHCVIVRCMGAGVVGGMVVCGVWYCAQYDGGLVGGIGSWYSRRCGGWYCVRYGGWCCGLWGYGEWCGWWYAGFLGHVVFCFAPAHSYMSICGLDLPKHFRQRQDSSLRGQSPMDFWSISLTTRTRCLLLAEPCVRMAVRIIGLEPPQLAGFLPAAAESNGFVSHGIRKKVHEHPVFLHPRQRQDSSLRGQSPMDFESISLTTRTRCLRGG